MVQTLGERERNRQKERYQMQLVIDIPNSIYANLPKIVNGSIASKRILDCVKNGTPLPKGHGRLVDADKLKMELERGIRAGNYEEGYEKYAHINDMDDCIDAVVYADTIIEADKESENEYHD